MPWLVFNSERLKNTHELFLITFEKNRKNASNKIADRTHTHDSLRENGATPNGPCTRKHVHKRRRGKKSTRHCNTNTKIVASFKESKLNRLQNNEYLRTRGRCGLIQTLFAMFITAFCNLQRNVYAFNTFSDMFGTGFPHDVLAWRFIVRWCLRKTNVYNKKKKINKQYNPVRRKSAPKHVDG